MSLCVTGSRTVLLIANCRAPTFCWTQCEMSPRELHGMSDRGCAGADAGRDNAPECTYRVEV